MITCGRCQTQNLDGSQFCDDCGAALFPVNATALGHNAARPEGRTGAYRFPPVESDEATVVRPDKAPMPAVAPIPVPLPPAAAMPLPSAKPPPPAMSPPQYEPPAAPSHRHQATAANSGLAFPPPLPGPTTRRPAPDAAPVIAKLVIERGRAAGKQFSLQNEESLIGRWDADGGIFPDVDLDADDPEAKVSRRHARIVRQSGQYYVEDLGSTNGTFINRGRRLLPGEPRPLNDGDELIIGKMFLRFYLARS